MADKFTSMMEKSIPMILEELGCSMPQSYFSEASYRFEICAEAANDVADGLIRRMSRVIKPSFERMFMNYLNEEDVLDDYLENEESESFDRIREGFSVLVRENSAAYLKEKLPVLPEIIRSTAERYREVVIEMLDRINDAYDDICGSLIKRNFSEITGIDSGKGDVHNFGRSTTIVSTNAGKFVYKPHDVSIDLRSAELTERFFPDVMQSPSVLCYKEYGFSEFVKNEPASTPEAAGRYYRRLGGMAAVVQMLGSYDLHHSNVLARNEYPVIIDYETMIAPGAGPAARGLKKEIGYSLLYSSLMPMRHGRIEGSILFATDEENPSAPVVDGRKLSVKDYPDEFIGGFRDTYMSCLSRRDEIREFLSESFKDVFIRHIYRNTGIYSQMMDSMMEPGWLSDDSRRDEIYKGFSRALKRSGYEGEDGIASAETDALMRGDIPYLYTRADGRDLYADGRIVCKDFFAGSSLDNILARLDYLGEDDLRFEVDLLRKAMTKVIVHKENPEKDEEEHRTANVQGPLSDEELISRAEDIFRLISDDAVYSPSGEILWFGPDYYLMTGMQLLSMGMMNGNAGLAVFFAAISKLSRDETVIKKANEYIESITSRQERIIDAYRSIDVIYPNTENISFSTGFAGKLMSSYILGKYTGDKRYDSLCRDIIGAMNRAELGFEKPDIYNGMAGALKIICSNDELFEMPGAAELSAKLADRIMKDAVIVYKGSKIWKTSSVQWPISGAGHGQSGVASALIKASERLGREDLMTAAMAGIEFEKDIYSPGLRAWPDMREHQKTDKYMNGYCSGASGIGLDALRTGYEGSDKIIELALDSVMKEPIQEKDILCCGNCAIIEFLLSPGTEMERDDLCDEARRRMTELISRADSKGHYSCLNGSLEDVISPGLFYGLAGIGYEMLRLAAPGRIKSVLP